MEDKSLILRRHAKERDYGGQEFEREGKINMGIRMGDIVGFKDRWKMQCCGTVIGINKEKKTVRLEYWKRNGTMGKTRKRMDEVEPDNAEDFPF